MVVVCVKIVLVGDFVLCWCVGCGVYEIICAGWWCGWSKYGDLRRVVWCCLCLMGVCVGGDIVVV